MIRVDQISFDFPGPIPALRSIDLAIAPGEAVAVVGANGSGKTTLARCLNGLHIPQRGRVFVDDLPTDDPTLLPQIRQRVGMVLQNPDDQLVATTVAAELAFGLENLALPGDEIQRRVEEALAAFDLQSYRHYPPHHLSGGEKQRVAIAAVVAMRPRYLILDEPTALLDPHGRRQVATLLETLRASYGIATILITQLPAEAARADRLVVLHQGRIHGDAAPRDLFADAARFRDLGLDLPFAPALAKRLALDEHPLDLDALADALASRRAAAPTSEWMPPPPPSSGPSKLRTADLSHIYNAHLPTRHQGISDIDLDVTAGSVVALIGASGSGKTTLAQHFNALLKPSRGSVLLDGVDIWSQAQRQVRQRVGLVFQFPELQLFAETVAADVAFGPDNLGFPRDRIDALVADALAMVGLPPAQFAARAPLSLSGGEKRRAALAGILAMDPEVLVLDEPTAGLDPRGTADLALLCQRLQQQGRTLVLISHDMDLVGRLATHVVVMQQGQIQLQGPARTVLADARFDGLSGLEPPAAVQLSHALKRRGIALSGVPLTLEETAAWLAPLLARQP